MLQQQTRRYALFLRVRDFGQQYRSRFADSSTAEQAFTAVAEAAAAIERHRTAKEVSQQQSRDARDAARRDLLTRMTTIARTARHAARGDSRLRKLFRLPRQRKDGVLINTARDFIAAGEASVGRWTQLGLPEGTLDALRQSVEALQRCGQAVGDGRRYSKSAKTEIAEALARGYDAIRELDVVVPNLLASDPVALSVWQSERLVGWRRREPKADDGAPVVSTDVEPATAPAASSTIVASTPASEVAATDDALRKAS